MVQVPVMAATSPRLLSAFQMRSVELVEVVIHVARPGSEMSFGLVRQRRFLRVAGLLFGSLRLFLLWPVGLRSLGLLGLGNLRLAVGDPSSAARPWPLADARPANQRRQLGFAVYAREADQDVEDLIVAAGAELVEQNPGQLAVAVGLALRSFESL